MVLVNRTGTKAGKKSDPIWMRGVFLGKSDNDLYITWRMDGIKTSRSAKRCPDHFDSRAISSVEIHTWEVKHTTLATRAVPPEASEELLPDSAMLQWQVNCCQLEDLQLLENQHLGRASQAARSLLLDRLREVQPESLDPSAPSGLQSKKQPGSARNSCLPRPGARLCWPILRLSPLLCLAGLYSWYRC